ncbi:hypothetical protein D3C87_60670 [compost metagenome]
MKRTLITSMAILGFIFTSTAQDKGKLEFGLGIGLNSSNISTTYDSADPSINFNLGATADYYFSDRWSIKAKFIYDRKGWDNDLIPVVDPGGSRFVRTDINVDYITVPVMAGWHFGSKRNWYLNFGPYIGFLMSAKDTELDSDLKDSFNTVDGGIAFGIGVKIPVSDKLKFFIEYEGQGGIAEVFKNNDGDQITNSRSAFNVGINFLLY